MFKKIMFMSLLLQSVAFAYVTYMPPLLEVPPSGSGKITYYTFTSDQDPTHINFVQIQIKGGFRQGGCNQRFAAVRYSENNKPLISIIMLAIANKTKISVLLNENDRYFGDRCTISRISVTN